MKVWKRATNEPWAITQNSLQNILEIAARENAAPEIVAGRLGKELQNNVKSYHEKGVAVIPVVGPLFRYSNLFTQVSGASSYELITQDFQAALAHDEIKAIVFDIDSPGGEVNGCAELANLIYEARGAKPIIAYASGDAASGAYWIASACDEIYCSPTSEIGSIGVVGVYHKDKDESSSKTIEIVSSQSPFKRVDPETDEGKAKIQQRIDDLAGVFIEAVAKNRALTTAQVESQYGKGDLFVGKKAVIAGLADEVSSFDAVLSKLNQTQKSKPNVTHLTQEDTVMDLQTLKAEHESLANQLITEGSQKERQRISAIIDSDEANTRDTLAKHLAFNTQLDVEQALNILGQSPKEQSVHEPTDTGFSKAMSNIPNPAIEPAAEQSDEDLDNVAKRIAAY